MGGSHHQKEGKMTEAENQDVNQEIVTPPVEEVSQTQDQTEGQEVHPQVEQESANDKEMNFKAIRESNARLQRRLDEETSAREHLEKLVETKLADQLKPVEEERDELDDIDEDDWLTKKNAEKLAEKRAREIVKSMLAEERQTRMKEELPNRVKSKHQDFDSVVTKENVEYLKANKPHIATTIAATKDPYAQAMAAYDFIKAFCPSANQTEEAAKMEKNASKPGTLGAAQAASPLSDAKALEKGLSPELKRKYQQEMIAAMRGS